MLKGKKVVAVLTKDRPNMVGLSARSWLKDLALLGRSDWVLAYFDMSENDESGTRNGRTAEETQIALGFAVREMGLPIPVYYFGMEQRRQMLVRLGRTFDQEWLEKVFLRGGCSSSRNTILAVTDGHIVMADDDALAQETYLTESDLYWKYAKEHRLRAMSGGEFALKQTADLRFRTGMPGVVARYADVLSRPVSSFHCSWLSGVMDDNRNARLDDIVLRGEFRPNLIGIDTRFPPDENTAVRWVSAADVTGYVDSHATVGLEAAARGFDRFGVPVQYARYLLRNNALATGWKSSTLFCSGLDNSLEANLPPVITTALRGADVIYRYLVSAAFPVALLGLGVDHTRSEEGGRRHPGHFFWSEKLGSELCFALRESMVCENGWLELPEIRIFPARLAKLEDEARGYWRATLGMRQDAIASDLAEDFRLQKGGFVRDAEARICSDLELYKDTLEDWRSLRREMQSIEIPMDRIE